MATLDIPRFQFFAEALTGAGGFANGHYLVRYPREDDAKFARRQEIAWYANALRPACQRFVGYLTKRPVIRDLPHPLLASLADACNWRNDSLDVFWSEFMIDAKARGSMLLIVDRPRQGSPEAALRETPYLIAMPPERVMEYTLDATGQLAAITLSDTQTGDDGKPQAIERIYDTDGWRVEAQGKVIAQGQHGLGVCPVLLFTEAGDFPHVGSFASIADLSKRLYNLRSELDEILRAQTFSLLAYPVTEMQSTTLDPRAIAQVISTHNLLLHYGASPQFIAPPEGPATIYLNVIERVENLIREAALYVDPASNSQESGVALQMRFQALNSALVHFARRMEDFERRLWNLVGLWLGLNTVAEIQWDNDYSLADLKLEIEVTQNMAALGAPPAYQAAKMQQLISLDLANLDPDELATILSQVDEGAQEAAGAAVVEEALP
jgi:hypothetical protein